MLERVRTIDRYILGQTIGTFAAVVGIVMSLMILEHLPRLIEITRLSGHRSYIVVQSLAGLLPEYGGIGLLVGLYLAIALTVRRLASRGEIEAIESVGVSPLRWMRTPLLLTIAVAFFTLLNQGWLMPFGEARLAQLDNEMRVGDFGYNLHVDQIANLGGGNVLHFSGVDDKTGYLTGVFLKTDEQVFSAARGRLWLTPQGDAVVDLVDGQAVGEADGRVLQFEHMRYQASRPGAVSANPERPMDPMRQKTLNDLLASHGTRDISVAYGRFLWAVLALTLPVLAFVLGKPPKRSAGSVGIFVGLAVLVLFLKMIALLTDGSGNYAEAMAGGIVAFWLLSCVALMVLEHRLGNGFLDRWIGSLVSRSSRSGQVRGPGKGTIGRIGTRIAIFLRPAASAPV